jgi:hypothetical protein
MSEINYENTIFIVDSYTTALMVSMIAKKNSIRCIYEIKDEFSSEYYNNFDDILSSNNIVRLEKIRVKQKFFILNKRKPFKTLSNIVKFKFQHRHLKIEKDCIYIGSITSTIMSFIDDNKRQYLDHGTGDYLARVKNIRYLKIKSLLNRFLISFGFFSIFPMHRKNGFTMCKITNDNFIHLDMTKYEVTVNIKNKLKNLIDFVSKYDKISLVLPVSAWHCESGVDGNTIIYDELNIKMCEDCCNTDELLLLKFHPSLKMAGNIEISLTSKLEAKGYKVILLNEFLPNELQYYLSAEIIVNELKIKKIVSEESSLLFNYSHVKDMELYGYPYLFDKEFSRDKSVINSYKVLNKLLINKILVDEKNAI